MDLVEFKNELQNIYEKNSYLFFAVFFAIFYSILLGLTYRLLKVYNIGEVEYVEVIEKKITNTSYGTYYNLKFKDYNHYTGTTKKIYDRIREHESVPIHIIKKQPSFYAFTGSESKDIGDFFLNNDYGFFNILQSIGFYLVAIISIIVIYYSKVKEIIFDKYQFGDSEMSKYEWRKRFTTKEDFEKFILDKNLPEKEHLAKSILKASITVSPFIIGFLISAIFMRIVIRTIYNDYNIGFLLAGLYLFLAFLFFLLLPYFLGLAAMKYKEEKKQFLTYIKLVISMFGILNFIFILSQILFVYDNKALSFKNMLNLIIDNYGSIFG